MHRALFLSLLFISVVKCLDSRWVMLWQDEFNGNQLDTTKWTARDVAGFNSSNGELQWYSPRQVSVSNGSLVIKSEKPATATNGFPYLSGSLDSSGKFAGTFGRYEIRAKLPSAKGMWPAHWMLSDYKCWPYGAEIDIMEYISVPNDVVYGTYHFGPNCGTTNKRANGTSLKTGSNIGDQFHLYSVEWNSSHIVWFYDEEIYHVVTNKDVDSGKPFDMDTTPHYIILNTAVGGHWPGSPDSSTVFPLYHYIDYVRVYGWQPCVTGCGSNGCCESTTQLCVCDSGYFGTNCEFSPTGDEFSTNFAAKTDLDTLTGNAVINNGLTLTVARCSTNCGGKNFTGGSWDSSQLLNHGNFSYVLKSSKTSGTSVLLYGIGTGTTYNAFQIGLANSNTISIQTFGENAFSYKSYNLGFDPSQDYHTYTMQYGKNFTLYADGKALVTFPATSVPLKMSIQYEYNTQYFGAFDPASAPVSVSVKSASWTIEPRVKAVCSSTTATTTTTTTSAATTATTTTTTATIDTSSLSSSLVVSPLIFIVLCVYLF